MTPPIAAFPGTVAYVGVDPNYALGPDAWLERYRVACRHETPAARLMAQRGVEVFCLEHHLDGEALPSRATTGLLQHPQVTRWLTNGDARPDLLVFKPNAQAEQAAAAQGLRILGAPAAIARPAENKVAFFRLLERLDLPHPAWREIDPSSESYETITRDLGPRVVVQGAHGFSGKGTWPVVDAAAYALAAAALGRRKAKASRMIEGSPMTLNACVLGPGRVRVGPLFHQVTGAPSCTPYPLGACGNDWSSVPPPAEVRAEAARIARSVGTSLSEKGFLGMFGLDFVITESGSVVTIECNPRLVSSVSMATTLELEREDVPLLASHMLATAGHDVPDAPDIEHGLRGSQLVLHNLSGASARVDGALEAGRYRLRGNILDFIAPALKPTECVDADDFLVLPAAAGHTVQAAGECARVQMRGGLLQFPDGLGKGLGELTPQARAVADAVQSALCLTPVSEDTYADDD